MKSQGKGSRAPFQNSTRTAREVPVDESSGYDGEWGPPSESTHMHPLHIIYLNGPDLARLALGDEEILRAVEQGLDAQGRGHAVALPRARLIPQGSSTGHLNVLSGAIRQMGLAGVKVAGDFIGNHDIGLPREIGLLTLFDPDTAAPLAIFNATSIRSMRAGATTALGARYLARKGARILGHIGAGETAYWNIRLLNHYFDFEEIRLHSKHPQSRDGLAAKLSKELATTVVAACDLKGCVRDADIVVETARSGEPGPQFGAGWMPPGALLVHYGSSSAIGSSLLRTVDKVVVDRREPGQEGLPGGSPQQSTDPGELTPECLHAELGQIIAGLRPGRDSESETILFRQRGLVSSDIALAGAMLDKAGELGIGQTLRFE